MDAKKRAIKRLPAAKPSELHAAAPEKASISVSVRALRKDWRRLKAMVARGAKIVVTDNGLPIMQLVPVEQTAVAKFDWVAHLQKIREIAGDQTTGTNSVIEERASHKW
jgi:antitoxin (DNA-binding transcriptional repressor) of toxin-antitoxin stability system